MMILAAYKSHYHLSLISMILIDSLNQFTESSLLAIASIFAIKKYLQ